MSVYITPVMFTDSTGMNPEEIVSDNDNLFSVIAINTFDKIKTM